MAKSELWRKTSRNGRPVADQQVSELVLANGGGPLPTMKESWPYGVWRLLARRPSLPVEVGHHCEGPFRVRRLIYGAVFSTEVV